MKVYCRYVVVDIQTGYALCAGSKYKDFDNLNIRYINNGSFRVGLFRRKITEYFRTLEIKGRDCVIVYWANDFGKEKFNYAYVFENSYFVRSQYRSLFTSFDGDLIEDLGVGYESV